MRIYDEVKNRIDTQIDELEDGTVFLCGVTNFQGTKIEPNLAPFVAMKITDLEDETVIVDLEDSTMYTDYEKYAVLSIYHNATLLLNDRMLLNEKR